MPGLRDADFYAHENEVLPQVLQRLARENQKGGGEALTSGEEYFLIVGVMVGQLALFIALAVCKRYQRLLGLTPSE